MFPKTSLRFSDSLEGLTELSKAIIPTVKVHYKQTKKIQIKISIRKRCLQSRRTRLLVVLSNGVMWKALLAQQ